MKKLLAAAVVGATCALSTGSAFAAITAKSYVSDGLVGQWDGKENAGYGVFNGEATSWADLTGKSVSFPVLPAWSFSDDGLTVTRANGSQNKTGYAGSAFAQAYANANFTVEIAYNKTKETPSDSGGYNNAVCTMLVLGQWQRNVGTLGDTGAGFDSPAKPTTSNVGLRATVSTTVGKHTFSCRQEGVNWTVDFDGAVRKTGSDAGTIAPADVPTGDGLELNRHYYANAGLDGQYYSIRFYERPLTDDEVAVNRAVDQIRYFGADPASYTLPTGWRFTTGGDVTLEHEATIAPKGGVGGQISVDGGEWADSASVWIEQGVGVTVAVKAMADEGYVFQGWSGNVEGEDLTLAETTLTVKGAVFAVFRKTDGSDPRSYSYVSSEAKAFWDDASVWRDEYGLKGVPTRGDSASFPAGKTLVLTNSTPELAALTIAGTLMMTNWTTCLKATDITVLNGGIITCGSPATTMETMSRVWIACSNLTVASGGKVDVDTKGYKCIKNQNSNGPGAPGDQNSAPSHGGFGAVNYAFGGHVVALPCDDPAAPEQPGTSGAGTPYGNLLQHGGGAVKVEASGTVRIDGSVLASGGKSDHSGPSYDTSYYGQPGAGGSIFITCREIVGAGTLRADGGNGEWPNANSWALSPGGGCIAIHYDAAVQKASDVAGMTISANCGKYVSKLGQSSHVNDLDDRRCQGDMGTLHFTDGKIVSALIGKTLVGQLRGFDSYVHEGNLAFSSGRVRFAEEGVQVTVNGDLVFSGSDSRLELGGGIATNRTGHVILSSGTEPCSLTVNGNLVLGGTSRLDIRSAATSSNDGIGATVTVAGEMSVSNGCRVVVWSDPITLGSPHFVVGDLTVAEGGVMTADARGGRSQYGGFACGPGIGDHGSGAGHGGRGGNGGTAAGRYSGGSAYDSATRPAIPGSGGTGWDPGYIPGDGGGRIFVSAMKGMICVDGLVSANGESDAFKYLGSPGSGGTILLEANRFVAGATACLQANAGSVTPGGTGTAASNIRQGASGGGRIAVWCGAAWEPNVPSSRHIVSESPLGDAFSEFFTWSPTATATASASVINGDYSLDDTPAVDGTVRYCYAPPKTGLLMLVR